MSVKDTMNKNTEKRTSKEIEYIVLYLREHFEIFKDLSKKDVQFLMKRLQVKNLNPGEILAHQDHIQANLLMLIDGTLEAFNDIKSDVSQNGRRDSKLKTLP